MVWVPAPATDGVNWLLLTPGPLKVPPAGVAVNDCGVEIFAQKGPIPVIDACPKLKSTAMGSMKSFKAAVEEAEAFVLIHKVLMLKPAHAAPTEVWSNK